VELVEGNAIRVTDTNKATLLFECEWLHAHVLQPG
jgi:hypothetical protein